MGAWGVTRDPHAPGLVFSKGTAIGGLSMHRLLLILTLALTATVGSLLFSPPTVAQILPPAKKAERVEITHGPALELAHDDLAIVRWTTNNPGGSDDHFGVVYYGTDPKDLSQMAKSPIRLNRGHPETMFREGRHHVETSLAPSFRGGRCVRPVSGVPHDPSWTDEP